MFPRSQARPPRRIRLAVESLEDRTVPSVAVTFQVTSDWHTGFGANMAIQNTGTTAANGGQLEFDFAQSIDTIWNAQIVGHQGSHYTL
jgi:hypothetical protein